MSESPMRTARLSSLPSVDLLVVGVSRSGTTLAQRLISELEGVSVSPETHFWRHAERMASLYEFPISRDDVKSLLDWFQGLSSSQFLNINPDNIVSRFPEDGIFLWELFSSIVLSLVDSDAEIVGEKTPTHYQWSVQLLHTVPWLKLVGIIRDPREVYRSHLEMNWGVHDPGTLAETWLHSIRTLQDVERRYDGRVHLVRYEDMSVTPDAFVDDCADLLGVDGRRGAAGRNPLFAAEEVWKARSLDAVEPKDNLWPRRLGKDEVRIIEQLCGAQMKSLGYEPSLSTETLAGPPVLNERAIEARQAAMRASSMRLPIAGGSVTTDNDRWQLRHQIRRAEERLAAEESRRGELAGECRLLRTERDGLRGERDWLKSERDALRGKVDELRHERDVVQQERNELSLEREQLRSRQAKSWRDLANMRLRALGAERRARRAEDRLARTKARRWWRLGAALGFWMRHLWDLRALLAVLRTIFGASTLPPERSLEELDTQIEKARADAKPVSSELRAARSAFAGGRYESALRIIDDLESTVKVKRAALLLKRDCHVRMGELTQALAVVRQVLAKRQDASLAFQARLLEGRLREMQTAWLPDAGSPIKPLDVPERCVLNVVKESLPFFERGYTIRSHSTFLAQSKAGWEPVVVTSPGFPRQQGFSEFPESEVIDGVVHHRLDPGPHYDLRDIPLDLQLDDHAMMLATMADEVRPAVVQAGSGYRGYETALVGLAVARRRDVPFIYEFRSFLDHTWTWEIERSEKGEQYEGRRQQELRCLRDADQVITIAEAMRNDLIELGVDGDKIAVVPNVVDVDRFAPRPPDEELREQYGFADRQVVGYISNLGRREGIDHLVRAVSHLRNSGRDVAGLIVGDGPEREALESLVVELGLQDHVVLTGHIPNEQIEAHYSVIDVFVVPRIDDKAARLVTPLKPLEAMAMGRPVVAADLPALHEQVEPGVRGELFQPGDSRHLADVLGSLLEDEPRRVTLGRAGREWVVAERTLASNVGRYAAVLDRVAKGVQ